LQTNNEKKLHSDRLKQDIKLEVAQSKGEISAIILFENLNLN